MSSTTISVSKPSLSINVPHELESIQSHFQSLNEHIKSFTQTFRVVEDKLNELRYIGVNIDRVVEQTKLHYERIIHSIEDEYIKNKYRLLQSLATEYDKILIHKEEYDDIKEKLNRKAELMELEVKSESELYRQKLSKEVEYMLSLKKMEYERDTYELRAELLLAKRELERLQQTPKPHLDDVIERVDQILEHDDIVIDPSLIETNIVHRNTQTFEATPETTPETITKAITEATPEIKISGTDDTHTTVDNVEDKDDTNVSQKDDSQKDDSQKDEPKVEYDNKRKRIYSKRVLPPKVKTEKQPVKKKTDEATSKEPIQ